MYLGTLYIYTKFRPGFFPRRAAAHTTNTGGTRHSRNKKEKIVF
jgi:hypothetical protein